MTSTKLIMMEELFRLCNIDWKDMKEGDVFVPKNNLFIKTQNLDTGNYEKVKVVALLRKFDDYLYNVLDYNTKEILLQCSGTHYLYTLECGYMAVENMLNDTFNVIDNIGNSKLISSIKTTIKSPILDISLEKNNNYFANNLLSHNSNEVIGVGNALKFYTSLRLDLRRGATQKEAGEAISSIVKVKTSKNKTAPPFQTCEIEVFYNEGISKVAELRDFGVELGLIEKSGSFYKIIDENGEIILREQGRIQFAQSLKQHSELMEKLENEIKSRYFTINN